MKTLSVLLLLALGLGASWWKLTYPEGTPADARREAGAVAARVQDELVAVRDRLPPLPFVSPADSAADPRPPEGAEAEAVAGRSPDAGDADGSTAEPIPTDTLAAEDPGADSAATEAVAPAANEAEDTRPSPPAALAATPETDEAAGIDGARPEDEIGAGEETGGEETTAVQRRLDDLERRLNAAARRDAATLVRLDEIDQRLERVLDRLERSEAVASTSEQVSAADGVAVEPFVGARGVEYKIYFGPGSTAITADAARVLDSLVAQERNRASGVSVFGFADPEGSPEVNREVALERATNVRDYLVASGLPAAKVRALNGLEGGFEARLLPENANAAQQRVVVLRAVRP